MTFEKLKLLLWLFKTDFFISSFTFGGGYVVLPMICLLYTSDAADEEDSVDIGGRRINKKNKKKNIRNITEV